MAVPLFFMISGALLFGKEEVINELYRKRVFKIVLVLLVFSLLQHIVYRNGGIAYIQKMYTAGYVTAYWYIYAYITMLCMLPLLRRMAIHVTNNEYIYMFTLCIQFEEAFRLYNT